MQSNHSLYHLAASVKLDFILIFHPIPISFHLVLSNFQILLNIYEDITFLNVQSNDVDFVAHIICIALGPKISFMLLGDLAK